MVYWSALLGLEAAQGLFRGYSSEVRPAAAAVVAYGAKVSDVRPWRGAKAQRAVRWTKGLASVLQAASSGITSPGTVTIWHAGSGF